MQFLPPHIEAELERMKRLGSDTQKYEVKAAGKALPENLAETISAFANRGGGTILLGLDEKHHFEPATDFDAKKIHDALLRIGSDLTPPCHLSIERYPVGEHEIVVAVVDPVPLDQRPCYITKRGMYSGAFIRTGDGDKKLTSYEVDRLREFHHQPAYDRIPVTEASMDDLDPSILGAIVRRNQEISPRVFGKMDSNAILVKLGAIVPTEDNSKRYVPTLSGLLVAGIFPQQFFPRLNITFTVYPGVTKAQTQRQAIRYIDSLPLNGSIPEMLMNALEQLKKYMNKGALIQGALRKEITDYPLLACREAIVNALQHRDYSPEGQGSQVQINLYADRLEILNPGGLYGASSFSSLPHGISATRNTRLSQLLEFTPFKDFDGEDGYVIENRGTGLLQIHQVLQESLMPEAELKDFVSAFQITFFKRRLSDSEKSEKYGVDFDAALLNELEKVGSMSIVEIMESSGFSRNTVAAHLRDLKKRGLIEGTERPNSPKQRYRLVRGGI